MNQKKIADDLREELQDGYMREYELEEKLLAANEAIMQLKADNAKLEQKIKL